MAALSYFFIENPIRYNRSVRSPHVLALSGTLLFMLVVSSETFSTIQSFARDMRLQSSEEVAIYNAVNTVKGRDIYGEMRAGDCQLWTRKINKDFERRLRGALLSWVKLSSLLEIAML